MLRKIKIQNFLSIGNEIQIDLDNQGLVGIFGLNKDSLGFSSNGVGKSALYSESLIWCLYGDTLRGLSNSDVINNKTGKDCKVSVTIAEDINEYEIIRTRGMSKSKKPNDLLVFYNGQDISKGTNQDTQLLINSIVGMDYVTFVQSVLLSYGTKTFSQMTNKEKNEVFEDILQINNFLKIQEAVSKELAVARSAVLKETTIIENNKIQLKSLSSHLENLNKMNEEFEDSKKKELSALREKIRLIEKDIEKKSQAAQELQDSIKQIPEINDILQEKGLTLNAFTTEVHNVEISLTKSHTELSISKKELEKRINHILKSNDTILEKEGANCDGCGQFVSDTYVESVVSHNVAEVRRLEQSLESVSKKVDEAVSNLKEIKERKVTTVSRLEKEIQQYKAILVELNKKSIIKNNIENEIVAHKNTAKLYNLQVDEVEQKPNTFLSLIADCEKNIKKVEEENDSRNLRLASLAEQNEYLELIYNIFGNSGIKNYLYDEILPFLQERAQYYVDILSDGDINIKFSTERELKNGNVKNELNVTAVNSKGSNVYEGSSAGEKQRIDLGIGWALGDLAAMRANKPINIKVCDEIFTHTDNTGIDNILKLLNKLKERYSSIFCITHDSYMQQYFDKISLVVKEDGFTKIDNNAS